jgi:hypothetical protein
VLGVRAAKIADNRVEVIRHLNATTTDNLQSDKVEGELEEAIEQLAIAT